MGGKVLVTLIPYSQTIQRTARLGVVVLVACKLRGHTHNDLDKFLSHIQFLHLIQTCLLAFLIPASFILYPPVPI